MFRSTILASAVAAGFADPILMPPPSQSSPATSLLVWVPGGNVNNTYYQPLMSELQKELEGKVDLWVSIAECPGNLCLPMESSLFVTNALNRGLNASGVDNSSTWMGGHSLGGVEADAYCRHNQGKTVGGGCLLWGSYVGTNTGGASTDNMLKYPVPVLQLVAELDFGSARATKMAPFYAWAEKGGKDQLAKSPVVLVPDVDHSDMCEGFPVPGDLPSASSPDAAIKGLVEPTASFMAQQIVKDKSSADSIKNHLQFTKSVMDPINEALMMEQNACEEFQKVVAGPFASKINSLTSKSDPVASQIHAFSPKAHKNHDGTLDITVAAFATREQGILNPWPVGPTTLGADAPDVGRASATSLDCRVVSRSALAALLGEDAEEPTNACRASNEAMFEWALSNVADRTIERYNSNKPCNSCAKGVGLKFLDDTPVEDITAFEKSGVDYDSFTISSPSLVTEKEYTCKLFSAARAVDFVMFDTFSASRYQAPTEVVLV